MTEPESTESTKETAGAVSGTEAAQAAAATDAAPPEPEPWTPERVLEWNAYYDLYVVLGVVLLAFAASANKITHASLWTHLKAGQIMAARGAPLVTDLFSYTEKGRPWVDIPWLFELTYAQIHKTAFNLIPPDPNEPFSPTRRAEQVSAGVLVALNALLRVATLFMLLAIRRAGPGLWWTAICATLALGAVITPAGVILGGLAGPAIVAPETWAQLFLATEFLLLHRTINLGRSRAVLGLLPLFLLWANVHESFLVGLVVLAAAVVGRIPKQWDFETDPLSFPRGLVLFVASAAICMVNPSFHRIYVAAIDPFVSLVWQRAELISSDERSFFWGGPIWTAVLLYYGPCVLAGVVSFALNFRRFSLSRFLQFVALAVFWGCLVRYSGLFAIGLATTLALNGQEWYQDRFGTEGRMGRGWAFLSTGGRFVTILAVFLLTAQCLTGYGRSIEESLFGFGYNPDSFTFEAADFLRSAKIKGEVLNTKRYQGDSIVWRAYPQRMTFIDSRRNVFPVALRSELEKIRLLLKDDKIAEWKPLLDHYNISVVMIEAGLDQNTYRTLSKSPNWIPFYDDGSVVMYGRADASADDVAFFKANRLDANVLVYNTTKPLPPSDRPPSPMGKLSEIFQNQWLEFAQPHTESAQRWLSAVPAPAEGKLPALPDPAHCIMAVREARLALARRPDDTLAYRILNEAYRDLMIQEWALLSGVALTAENQEKIVNLPIRVEQLMDRFRQRATALNFAIQTTPPPRSDTDRRVLIQLEYELFQLYMSANFQDLAHERLRAMLAHARPDDLNSTLRDGLMGSQNALDNYVRQIQEAMSEMVVQQQATPLDRANFALARGAPGLAIQELEEALQINVNPALVKPKLLDLYCDTGQPEKALDLLATSASIDDPNLGREAGIAALRQGRVYYLLGNYEYAATLWQKNAIPQLRRDRSAGALASGQYLVQGEAKVVANILMNLPTKLSMQAVWENELALCELESGEPTRAAKDFAHALTLMPKLPTRAVSAYYLERLGTPVPPLPESDTNKSKADAVKKDGEKPAEAAKDEKADQPADAKKDGEKPAEAAKDEKADQPADAPKDEKK